MSAFKFSGLCTATHTPFHADGSLNLDAVGPQAAYLRGNGITSVFIGGTTGESSSLTAAERAALNDRWAVVGPEHGIDVIVHVGANCLTEAAQLAAHAERNRAKAVSMIAPSYFKPRTLGDLVASCAMVARQMASAAGFSHVVLYATNDGQRIYASDGNWFSDMFASLQSDLDKDDRASGEAHLLDVAGGMPLATVTADAKPRDPLNLVDGGRCWVKLSAPYHGSKTGAPRYEDAGATAMELIRAAPDATAAREQLMARAWPDLTVDDSNLRFHIAGLRKALDDGAGLLPAGQADGSWDVRALAPHDSAFAVLEKVG